MADTKYEEKAQKDARKPMVKHTVIDEPLIIEAVKEDRLLHAAQESAIPHNNDEEVKLKAIKTLVLSYKDIFRINNLQGFRQLTKLQLDNNVIERIENLGHLSNLTWLDLSFNKISRIENLGALTKLKDLSLAYNDLEEIGSGLDNLTNLEVLSLGNNRISVKKNGQLRMIVEPLRRFKKLRLLNLSGNPMVKEPQYRDTVCALLCCLPGQQVTGMSANLKYLDFQMIEDKEVKEAKDRLQDTLKLNEIEDREKLEREKEEVLEQRAKDMRNAEEANLTGVADLFDSMKKEDAEQSKLMFLEPGFDSILQDYGTEVASITAAFIAVATKHHLAKQQSRAQFMQQMQQIKTLSEAQGKAYVSTHDDKMRKAFALVDNTSQEVNRKRILDTLKAETNYLLENLMEFEMKLVEDIQKIQQRFKSEYSELVKASVSEMDSFFSEMEGVISSYSSRLNELVSDLTQRFMDNKLTDHTTIEMERLLSDKDQLRNAVRASHDNQSTYVYTLVEALKKTEKQREVNLFASIKTEEYERNRHRVSEIADLVGRHKGEIRNMRDPDSDDDFEDSVSGDDQRSHNNEEVDQELDEEASVHSTLEARTDVNDNLDVPLGQAADTAADGDDSSYHSEEVSEDERSQ